LDWRSKADVVDASIREYKLTAHSLVGNHLWGVIETSVGSMAVLVLIEGRGGEWSRKAISEDMGPCYYDVPDKILKAATGAPNAEWRSKVLAAKAAKKAVFAPGSQVRVDGSRAVYTVEGRHSATQWLIADAAGKRYRCATARLTVA
jgi:hypothetical protein